MIQKLKSIAKHNCKVGKRYPVIEVTRKSDQEYMINGYGIFVDMDGSWTSNPPINDVILKTRISAILQKMKRCKNNVLCSPADVFANLEQCTICKRTA